MIKHSFLLFSAVVIGLLTSFPPPVSAATIPQTDWQLKYADSQELVGENGVAINAFDGDPATIWHTEWKLQKTPLPHEIQIDLGAVYSLDGFRYLPRQDGGVNGTIIQYQFYVSLDGNTWGVPVKAGALASDLSQKEVLFPTVTGRFVRLVALKEIANKEFTSMAELNLLGTRFTGNLAPESVINTPSGNITVREGATVNFTGTGSDPDQNLPLSYSWNFGDPAIANAAVEDPGLIQFNTVGTYTVFFTVTDGLGKTDPTPASRTVTVLNSTTAPLIPQANWHLKYVDSQEIIGENGAAINAFDGDPATIWHTEWKLRQVPLPHEIQIDLGAIYNLEGFRYLPRQDGGINGTIVQYQFYVSLDGSNWGVPVKAGALAGDLSQKEVLFPTLPARFVRLVAQKEINSKVFTSMAELRLLGTEFTGNLAPEGTIDSPTGNITISEGGIVAFAGTGSDPDQNLPLSYRWHFGDPAIADVFVEDPGQIQFHTVGTYTVTLTVTDALGKVDPTPASRTITVQAPQVLTIHPDWSAVTAAPFKIADPSNIHNPVLSATDVTDVPARFVADPFLFQENGTFYLFFEVLNTKNNLGEIGVAKSSDAITWKYDRIVLKESFHLSYPYVFSVNGKHYMIPETNEALGVRLYEAASFPYDWKLVSTLASGRHFVDPSLVYYNNYWWMFVGVNGADDCYLYYSKDLLSGWTEHPKSPIVINDPAHSRPGGRAFVYNGKTIIRSVQKADVFYIRQVRTYQVDELTTTSFAEHEVAGSPVAGPSGAGWNAAGSHQYDPLWLGDHWIAAIDGRYGSSFADYAIGIYATADPAAPDSTINQPATNMTINVGGTINFQGSGTDPNSKIPLTYLWQFGDGSEVPASSLNNPGPIQFNRAGQYKVTFAVANSAGLVDNFPATRVITVLADPITSVIPQKDWKLKYVDSQELVAENGAAINAFDGNPLTIWHTQWKLRQPPLPHQIQIDLGTVYNLRGFRYLPRQDGGVNGTIAHYALYVSLDGVNWGTPVVQADFGSGLGQKEVFFPTASSRYVRLEAMVEINGKVFTSAAEFNFLGEPEGGTPVPQPVAGFAAVISNSSPVDTLSLAATGTESAVITSITANPENPIDQSSTSPAAANAMESCDSPSATIMRPADNALSSASDVIIIPDVCLNGDLYSGWGLKYLLDGAFPYITRTAPYSIVYKNVDKSEHTVEIVVVDSNGNEMSGTTTQDQVAQFGVGDYYVALGDSVTTGAFDDILADNVSRDGRNSAAGYTPILNNLLTGDKGYPHTVAMEGVAGDTAADGLARLPEILSHHPESQYYLILYGTNDAAGLLPTAPATFKTIVQKMISQLQAAGKRAYLAKVPYSLDAGRNSIIQDYNMVIEQLVAENAISVVPPDFYGYFATHQDQLSDTVHPNGRGYQAMAALWQAAMHSQ